jgi:hypothetical protein
MPHEKKKLPSTPRAPQAVIISNTKEAPKESPSGTSHV